MANRFWVGGTGDWNTSSTTNWSATSGGSSGASNPTSSDAVFFDANSGGGTATIKTNNINVLSIDMTGYTGTLAGNTTTLTVNGNITLGSGMTMTFSASTTISANCTLTSNGVTWTSQVILTSGSPITVNLGDHFVCTNANGITVGSNCTLNANNKNYTGSNFSAASSTSATVTMGSGLWSLTGTGTVWDMAGATSLTINTNTSQIKATNTSNSAITFSGLSKTYNNIWFSRGASTGSITIVGSSQFTEFKDTGTAAHSIIFTAGITTTIPTAAGWIVSGSAGNLITINSTTTATHTISIASGNVMSNYLNIQHSIATGGATFYAGANSTDNNSVASAGSGWLFNTLFITTYAETVGSTDALVKKILSTFAHTQATVESLVYSIGLLWNNAVKHVSTWINEDK